MALAPGFRLGPYEVVAPLGAGGMGEVYRATDVRLGRQVAVKVLSERLAADADALARFEREARAVAALSHPAICTLHDVGREGETSYLVMELLEGETLAERIRRGPLSLEQVVKVGGEIGGALAAAHERGIVHRDLKPGNVMLTRAGIKLLDFGLARALEEAHAGPDGAVPTASVNLNVTQEGVLLGTLPYMSPEQLEGHRADARSDIFAFGAVLYEMATGQRAFSGRSQASLISAILTSQPAPISSLRPLSPAGLDQLVQVCLAKDPLERWQSARDVVLQLRMLAESQGQTVRVRPATQRLAWLAWGIAALALALLGIARFRARAAPAPQARTVKFEMPPPRGGFFTSWAEAAAIAVSPDGTKVAFSASDAQGQVSLWVRSVSSTELRRLPGSEDAVGPFWSPDSQALGFASQGKLKRLELAGGAPITLCEMPQGGGLSASWGKDSILFVVSPAESGGLYRVSASGGAPVVEVATDRDKSERRLAWPAFLPDGEHFLYLVRRDDFSWHLMMSGPDKTRRELGNIASAAQFTGPGHLAFVRDGTLLAQRFDWRTGVLSGEPNAIAETVRYFLSTGSAAFSASPAGTLAYQSRDDVDRLAWFDRSGRELSQVGRLGSHLHFALAADGQRVLYDLARPGTGTYDIWAWDVGLQVESRLTSHPETEITPRFLPGGAIVYSANLKGRPPQMVRRDLATGEERELLPAAGFRWAEDVTPDGQTLLYSQRGANGTTDIWALSLNGPPNPRPLLQSEYNEQDSRLSPDGRMLAFVSDESGHSEAYVMPYPGPGEKRRVSSAGAAHVGWRRDGRELLMLGREGVWSLPVRGTAPFEAGAPKLLFALGGKPWRGFELTPDGQRLLAIVPQTVGNEEPATVVLDWAAAPAP